MKHTTTESGSIRRTAEWKNGMHAIPGLLAMKAWIKNKLQTRIAPFCKIGAITVALLTMSRAAFATPDGLAATLSLDPGFPPANPTPSSDTVDYIYGWRLTSAGD